MGTFYLHIGMHKTASSSCQQLFERKRALLAKQGLRYFKTFNSNHSFFLITFFNPENRDVDQLIESSRIDPRYASERDELWRRWCDFLAETGASGDDALMSGEVGGFLADDAVIRLRDHVLAHFDRMVVLMLIRPPLSFARSAAQQRLKGQYSFERMLLQLPAPKYRRRLRMYKRALGPENIRLEVFHPDRMVDGDPAQTLLAMMGKRGRKIAALRAPRVNEAISRSGAKLLSALQAIRVDGAREADLPAGLRESLRALPPQFDYAGLVEGAYAGASLPPAWMRAAGAIPGPKFTLPAEARQVISAKLEKDVAWASRLLGADIWSFDSSRDEDAPSFAELARIGEAEAADIIGHLAGLAAPRAA